MKAMYFAKTYFVQKCSSYLRGNTRRYRRAFIRNDDDRKIVIEEDEETRVYAAPQYHMEVNTARMLLDLNIHYDVSISEVETMIAMIEETEQITFAEKQKEAIHAVVTG